MSQTATTRGGHTATRGSHTAAPPRGITLAEATRSSNPELQPPLPPPQRKRKDPVPDDPPPSMTIHPHRDTPCEGGLSGHGGRGGGGDLDDDGDSDDNGAGDDVPGVSGIDRNSGNDLIEVLTTLTHKMQPQQARAKPKVKEPDTFNSSNLKKLNTFLIQCGLYFCNYEDYEDNE